MFLLAEYAYTYGHLDSSFPRPSKERYKSITCQLIWHIDVWGTQAGMFNFPFINFDRSNVVLIIFIRLVFMSIDNFDTFLIVKSNFFGLEKYFGEEILPLEHLQHLIELSVFVGRLLSFAQHIINQLLKYSIEYMFYWVKNQNYALSYIYLLYW